MITSVVLFTSDLRVHDHPPLRAALACGDAVVPLFVRDRVIDGIGFAGPNREAFLADCRSRQQPAQLAVDGRHRHG
ncbi:deoxyribodipyrimidine photo-lyase [Streptomyces sp. NPDC003006]